MDFTFPSTYSASCFHTPPPDPRARAVELAMDEQEKRKLDRKRARNRAAATKCRQKKIDRIQELEGLVATEKQRAQNLDLEMESLRSTLHQLQQLIQMHEQRGCARS
ncbi:bZIP transcription factor [Ancylostoma ceylanicum]|uniref:BZIP transcription factor n=2 Tax=Ancylostoma ceylanicum TaxID=53326 RepID=A0A0D6LK39_9BILA|nr:bZIP transcription factor [Ancylostoma ceylanicum]EYC28504.1 hypothetical protein Y032_0007g3261 [Ancylostoma ceylanicum]